MYENLCLLLSISFNLLSSIFKGNICAPTLLQRQVYEALLFLTFETDQFLYLAMCDFLILKKIRCVLPANACCTVYVNCSPPSQFSMLFLFKINNSMYISFQSFINTQILAISHIILFQSMFVYFE